MSEMQATLRQDVHFEGVGLHTGAPCRARVQPAPPNSGLAFRLPGGVAFPATAEYVIETARATVLGKDGVSVSTVEHLLAAIFGCGITNATISIEGPEVPVADGSAKAFVDAIARVGVVPQSEVRQRLVLSKPLFVRDGDRCIVALPASSFRIKFMADFAPPVNAQYIDCEMSSEYFMQEIAGARTFGYLHEVEALRKRGLAQGGSLENAVVFGPDGPMQPLRWPNEVVRHKVLDLMGDFALLGGWPQFEVIAVKSGHKLHCIAAVELRKQFAMTLPEAKVR